MLKYTLKRILGGIITIYFVATFTFFAMHFVPGDPLIRGKAISHEIRANLEEKYGLNKPLHVQYYVYITNMLKGDFGISFTQQNRSVNDIIKAHFPISATLGILALVIAAGGGIFFGALAALFRNKMTDRTIMFFVILCVSVPAFVTAAVGQYGLTELNKWYGDTVLPVAGWGSFQHMILPALVLGLGTMAFLTRMMRTSMLEIVNQDYIRTARSKGLSKARIFFVHQLRNSVLPVITILGPAIATITTGGFVAEIVFAIPGLGRYFVQATQQLDYTAIMGLTTFYAAFLIAMVIIVDIVYGFIDPRIRLAKG